MANAHHNLLVDFFSDLEPGTILWQLAVLAFSLIAAWIFNRLLKSHFPVSEGASKFGLSSLYQVLFPLITLLLILIGKAVLKKTGTPSIC